MSAPPKRDLANWRAAGGTPAHLRRLLENARPWEPSALSGFGAAGSQASASQQAPFSRIITADQLSAKTFPDPKWSVSGVVPASATVLVGSPKKGKSWLLLGLGIAIGAGGQALGKFPRSHTHAGQGRGEPSLLAPRHLHLISGIPRISPPARWFLPAGTVSSAPVSVSLS
jgi:hypothetical protein